MRMKEQDPRKIIRSWGALVTEVAPRVSPILLLVRAAASADPQMTKLLAEMDADRHRRMTINARHLHDGGHLRSDVTLQQATDILWTYSSAELYDLLVLRRGVATRALRPFCRRRHDCGSSTDDFEKTSVRRGSRPMN
jgi:hypothetical protein